MPTTFDILAMFKSYTIPSPHVEQFSTPPPPVTDHLEELGHSALKNYDQLLIDHIKTIAEKSEDNQETSSALSQRLPNTSIPTSGYELFTNLNNPSPGISYFQMRCLPLLTGSVLVCRVQRCDFDPRPHCSHAPSSARNDKL